MLDTTLSTRFVPGTNLKGDVTGANWTYALPSFELYEVLCVGLPPLATLRTLSGRANEVIVACRDDRTFRKALQVVRDNRLANLLLVPVDREYVLPLVDGQVDLVVIGEPNGVHRLRVDSPFCGELRRVLAPGGLIYVEGDSRRSTASDKGVAEFAVRETFSCTPRFGSQVRTIVPAEDRETNDFFWHKGLESTSTGRQPFAAVERLVRGHDRTRALAERCGLLLSPRSTETKTGPPRYLREIAAQSGIDLTGYRWGLAASGIFPSQKVLFFLFEPKGTEPKYVVKLTRDASLNYRLENEHRGLAELVKLGIGDASTVPRPGFFGYHGQLAIVGETAIEGRSFDQCSTMKADCPRALAAIEWFGDLAARTVDTEAVSPRQVAEGLHTLLEQFVDIYRPPPARKAFLESQVDTIGDSLEPFPLVFQHGDPGAWNLMITDDERIAVLDWEAAEPRGMPLWDLFYFLRSYAVRMARHRAVRGNLRGFAHEFLNESPFRPVIVESVRTYCRRIGLSEHLVEPLYNTCWMHRALKEATRLPQDQMSRGHYARLLDLSILRRDASTLAEIFRNASGRRAAVTTPEKASRISAVS